MAKLSRVRVQNLRRTWEFDPHSPSRSILPLYITSWIICTLRVVGVRVPSARTLFLAGRLSFFIMSLLLDLCFRYLLPSGMTRIQRSRALCLWACSGAIFAFQIRTFSNSTEAVILAGCLICVKHFAKTVLEPSQDAKGSGGEYMHSPKTSSTRLGSALGVMLAFGTFTRVTFAPFASPTVLCFVYLSWLPLRSLPRTKQVTSLFCNLLPVLLSFLAASAVFISVDTVYYSTFLPVHGSYALKIAPLNLFRYNISTSNLALHGIHPRWLHFLVNLPMVIGVSAFGVSIATFKNSVSLNSKKNKRGMRHEANVDDYMQRVCLATVFAGTAVLSLAPHQEPRFLAPLALPGILLFSSMLPKLSPGVIKALVVIHIAQSIVITAIFSKLHQAGLLPALFVLNTQLRAIAEPSCPGTIPSFPPQASIPTWFDRESTSKVVMVFWKTFPPPRHLLLPPRTSLQMTAGLECESGLRQHSDVVMEVIDLMGAPTERVSSQITSLNFTRETVVLLISPSYAIKRLKDEQNGIVLSSPLFRFGPHVNMDDLNATLEMGVWEGFKLEARKILASR